MQDELDGETLEGRRLFGEYTVKQKLGEGGMGAVYLVEQDRIGQQIAVKVLHDSAATSDELVQRFNREAKAVSMLNHPNITRLFIFGRSEDGLIYLAMEYVNGVSLREAFIKGPMAELRAIRIMKQVLSALAEAHHMGIIHRDLKPDNIMLTEYRGNRDFVKVLDFGIAKVKEPQGAAKQQKLTQAGVVYGTPEYLSPEQAQAMDLDPRSDIYSLGCILYEMVTGDVPFSAPTAVTVLTKHVFEEPKSPTSINPACSAEMEAIVLKAMSKKPIDRYEDADAFLQALVDRESQLVAEGQKSEQVVLPGQDIASAGLRPLKKPMQEESTLAATQLLDSKVALEQIAAANGSSPSKRRGDEDESGAQAMRRVLIGLIVFCGFLLLALVAAIAMVWYYKQGGA